MVCLRVGFFSLVGFALAGMAESGYKSVSALPQELWQNEQRLPNTSLVVSDAVDFGEPHFEVVGPGEARVSLPGARTLRVETLPEIPYYERAYEVGADTQVQATWSNAVAFRTDGPVPLRALPETFFWAADKNFELAKPGRTRFFPGTFLQVVKQGTQALVRFFPLQWDTQNHEMIRLTHLNVDLFRRPVDGLARSASRGSESVILVREAQKDMARALQEFHLRNYAMASEIVTVESVEKSEKEIDESSLPEGYKDRSLADDSVVAWDPKSGTGYPYSLARKLIAYFQNRLTTSTKLKYITLLGDGAAIPPSYYFSVRAGFGARFGVTDQCYSAVNQCLDPKASVGRLPFTKPAELKSYFAKVERWMKYAPTSSSELALFGGKAFAGPFYIGELGSLRAMPDRPTWRGLQKFFRTKQNYTRSTVLSSLGGAGDSSILFSLDHGTGNSWRVEKNGISSEEILELKTQGRTVNPLIFSIACINAAFDETTTKDEIFSDPDLGEVSVGVALLKSVAGSVAYFGSARNAMGAPLYDVDSRGNLTLLDSNHGLKLMETAIQAYHGKGEGRLGDFTLAAFSEFASNPASKLSVERFRWSFLNATLLGDPVMSMPKRQRSDLASAIASAVSELEEAFSGYFPTFLPPLEVESKVEFESFAPVEATLYQQEVLGSLVTESVLKTNKFAAGKSELAFEPGADPSNYFMRIENKTGVPVERQVWFRTQ